jgi:hypothetical protein
MACELKHKFYSEFDPPPVVRVTILPITISPDCVTTVKMIRPRKGFKAGKRVLPEQAAQRPAIDAITPTPT